MHTSLIEPLPHQITAVYETMLTKQPLRYLLADDPGAGKTIMTGLLIKAMLNASSVLVKPEVAAAASPTPAPVQAMTTMTYADAPAKPNQAVSERGGAAILEPASTTPMPVSSSPSDAPGQVAPTAAGEPQYHRFYGSVKINPRMMALDAGKIMEEVVKHLTTLYGADVQVTLEIQATLPGGAPESTRRTIEENCRTLRFEGYGFEVE